VKIYFNSQSFDNDNKTESCDEIFVYNHRKIYFYIQINGTSFYRILVSWHMEIEHIKLKDIIEASKFIKKVFDEFIAEDYSEKGAGHFYELIDEQSIQQRFLNGNMIIVAKSENRITGYIEITNLNHIYLLFVAKEFQKKGIGRKLIYFSLNMLIENNPELTRVTVNSTSFAIKFYEKLGFGKMADFQYKNGIISYPMSIMINRSCY